MLDIEFEVKKLIAYVGDQDRKTCCGRNRIVMRFHRVVKALSQARASGDYNQQELDEIESLIDELAEQFNEVDLSGIKRRYKC